MILYAKALILVCDRSREAGNAAGNSAREAGNSPREAGSKASSGDEWGASPGIETCSAAPGTFVSSSYGEGMLAARKAGWLVERVGNIALCPACKEGIDAIRGGRTGEKRKGRTPGAVIDDRQNLIPGVVPGMKSRGLGED